MIAGGSSRGTGHVQFYRSCLLLQGQCQSPHPWIAEDLDFRTPDGPAEHPGFLPAFCLILLESPNPVEVWFVLDL
jgi:hypothetical protein